MSNISLSLKKMNIAIKVTNLAISAKCRVNTSYLQNIQPTMKSITSQKISEEISEEEVGKEFSALGARPLFIIKTGQVTSSQFMPSTTS